MSTNDPPGAQVRLEVQIARPPTRKCREVLAVMEEAVGRFPGQARLVVYERGAPWSERPTTGFRTAAKFTRVPKSFVNGRLLAFGEVPALVDVLTAIREELSGRLG